MKDPHEKLLEETVRTPAWLPLVGLGVFFAAAVYLVVQAQRAPDVTLQAPAAPAAAVDAGTAVPAAD